MRIKIIFGSILLVVIILLRIQYNMKEQDKLDVKNVFFHDYKKLQKVTYYIDSYKGNKTIIKDEELRYGLFLILKKSLPPSFPRKGDRFYKLRCNFHFPKKIITVLIMKDKMQNKFFAAFRLKEGTSELGVTGVDDKKIINKLYVRWKEIQN